MPEIICFGDSNTYGYYPNGMGGSRYPSDVRWTGLLESRGFTVINEGMNGRCVPRDPCLFDHLIKKLGQYAAPDVFMIMLGGNDLLQDATAETVAGWMDNFLAELPRLPWFDASRTLLVSPAPLREGAWVYEQLQIDYSMQLGSYYRDIAAKHGIAFADAADWNVEKVFDGVHFSKEGHRAFADGLMSVPLIRESLEFPFIPEYV